MTALLEASVQYPTIVFTVLLGVCMVYWLLVIVGALGIDVLDDLELFQSADGADAADAAGGGTGDGRESAGLNLGLFSALGLRQVPVTLVLSFVTLWSWILCQLGVRFLLDGPASFWGGTAILIVAYALAFPLTAVSIRPLVRLLKVDRSPSRSDLVGKTVTISTSRVDDDFGSATAEDGGAGLIVQVRCGTENGLERGDEAIVVSFDPQREVYEVAPLASTSAADAS